MFASYSAVDIKRDCEDVCKLEESWCLVTEEDWEEGKIVPIVRGGREIEDEGEARERDEELLTPAESELGDSGYIV